jgi:hypothetical protein
MFPKSLSQQPDQDTCLHLFSRLCYTWDSWQALLFLSCMYRLVPTVLLTSASVYHVTEYEKQTSFILNFC